LVWRLWNFSTLIHGSVDSSSFYVPRAPLSHLESSYVDHHLYADETQLFVSFSPVSFLYLNRTTTFVVDQISQWMSSNLPCLNPSKTEFIYHNRPIYLPKSRKSLTLQYYHNAGP